MNHKRSYRAPYQLSRSVAQVVHHEAFEKSIAQLSRTNIAYFYQAKKKRPQDGNPDERTAK